MRVLLLLGVIILHVASSAISTREIQQSTKRISTLAGRCFQVMAENLTGNLGYSPVIFNRAMGLIFFSLTAKSRRKFRQYSMETSVHNHRYNHDYWKVDSTDNEELQWDAWNTIFRAKHFSLNDKFSSHLKRLHVDVKATNERDEISGSFEGWNTVPMSHLVTELVDKTGFNREPALLFVSAANFESNWTHIFNENETEMRPFHVNGKNTKNVPTMRRIGNYLYGELPEVKSKFIEIPYALGLDSEEPPVSMFIILPDEISGISQLIRNIQKISLQKLRQGQKRKIELLLPKFRIESTIDLAPCLNQLDLGDLMTDSANFSVITDKRSLKIGKMVHTTTAFDIDELGTRATRNPVYQMESCGPGDISFTVNHPFISIIMNDDEHQFFTIAVVDPSSESG